jgi:hypothetical protein
LRPQVHVSGRSVIDPIGRMLWPQRATKQDAFQNPGMLLSSEYRGLPSRTRRRMQAVPRSAPSL